MRISVIGCGYLGAVHAACMASLGHEVIGVDVNAAKVAKLNAGEPPFFEPGFKEILSEQVKSGRLAFTCEYADAADAQISFIAVGTPQSSSRNAADMSYVESALDGLLTNLTGDEPKLIVGKSTVPVGTAEAISRRLAGKSLLVWNPEFLREGFAVDDTLHPDRIVYGLPADPGDAKTAQGLLDECYSLLLAEGIPRLLTDYATAELVKVAANSFLATKISFINAMAELCDASGADVTKLAEAIGYDDRIGKKFLRAGLGFGGGCLPKDIRAFMARAGELGVEQALTFLREVDTVNLRSRQRAVEIAKEMAGGTFVGRRVAVLGAAFKPNSDDLRDSPALDIAQQISARGADMVITDPQATDGLRAKRPNLCVVDTAEEAMRNADVTVLGTEWREYVELDPAEAKIWVHQPNILDGRNVLDAAAWQAAGWNYRGIGRR